MNVKYRLLKHQWAAGVGRADAVLALGERGGGNEENCDECCA